MHVYIWNQQIDRENTRQTSYSLNNWSKTPIITRRFIVFRLIKFLKLIVTMGFAAPCHFTCFCSLRSLTVPLTLKNLALQGHLWGEKSSMRAREADSLTNWPTGIAREKTESETIYFFIFPFFFSSSRFTLLPSLALWQTPLTLASSPLFPFSGLSYVVSERQPSFAPPRELQASVTLSYTRHVKSRRQANSNRSVQNQVKCRRLYSGLLVIVTFGEQKRVIWEEEKMA